MHSLSAVLSFVVLLALLLHIRKEELADNEEMNEKKYFLSEKFADKVGTIVLITSQCLLLFS